jgi:hypothetical protein
MASFSSAVSRGTSTTPIPPVTVARIRAVQTGYLYDHALTWLSAMTPARVDTCAELILYV